MYKIRLKRRLLKFATIEWSDKIFLLTRNILRCVAAVSFTWFSWCFQFNSYTVFVTRQANLCLRAFRHDNFLLRMPSHSEEPGIWLFVWRFLLTHCLYERAVEVLARIGDKYQIRLTRPIWYCHAIINREKNFAQTGYSDVTIKLVIFLKRV